MTAMVVGAAEKLIAKRLEKLVLALKLDERLQQFEQKSLATFERRLSRHSDHLSRIQSRLQALEQGGVHDERSLDEDRLAC
jgi:tellurite resistance protein